MLEETFCNFTCHINIMNVDDKINSSNIRISINIMNIYVIVVVIDEQKQPAVSSTSA